MALNILGAQPRTLERMTRLRRINSGDLRFGLKKVLLLALVASSLTLAATAPVSSVPASYTVQAGDTLSKVSRQFGVSVANLKSFNALSEDGVEIGQVLLLAPSSSTKPTTTKPPATPSSTPAPLQTLKLGALEVTIPSRLKPGDPFAMRFKGPDAARVTVRFPSETGEDVRKPGELLSAVTLGNDSSLVLGRAVLGAVSGQVRFEARLGDKLLQGKITLELPLRPSIDAMYMPQSVLDNESEATRRVENDALEAAYALRTQQQWISPFITPLESVITSPFGSARRYKSGGKVNYHYGTDLRGKAGTPIRAVNRGTVVVAGVYATRGGLTVIDHGAGVVSAYFHQSKIGVKVGDSVEQGQIIGQVGSSGYALGPHLHWEMRVRGEATDPWKWAGKLWP